MSRKSRKVRAAAKEEALPSHVWLEGVNRIEAERRRQIEEEGFDTDHDLEHVDGALTLAALCYARAALGVLKRNENCRQAIRSERVPADWPWSDGWKPDLRDARRDLARAGALIAAELDRLFECGWEPEETEDA